MAIIVQDPFTEAGDVPLQNHTANTTGGQWVDFDTPGTGTMDVEGSSDQLGSANVSASTRAIYTSRPNPTSLDIDMQITVVTVQSGSDDPFFFIARAADVSNYYSGGSYQTGALADKKIFKIVSGVKTELATGDGGLANGDIVKFEVRDATKKVYLDDVEQISTSDNTITANGSCGFGVGNAWATSTDDVSAIWRFDNYIVTEVSAAATVSLPPQSLSMLPFLVR